MTDRSSFLYTSHFCEENIYHLVKSIQDRDDSIDHLYVVFITSLSKATPIWEQRLAYDRNNPVLWDYHVILIKKPNLLTSIDNNMLVYDFDTHLSFPCEANEYISRSFRYDLTFNQHVQIFRVIQASQYLNHFSSDRSHMDSSMVAFPNWPCIMQPQHDDGNDNYVNFMDMYVELDRKIRNDLCSIDLNHDAYTSSPTIDHHEGVVYSKIRFQAWLRGNTLL